MKATFKGVNVFMSRNLVPPEIFDSLHNVLKDNGANIFLCCDPSRNGPSDYHIISSRDHEKFADLRENGCQLLGPQCVFSCGKEHIVLPKQGFTCCLAMDGAKILASGFEMEEKVEIGKLVTAMGGQLQTKAVSDVSFVIAKNVLAAKYKWALNNLKKPIVSESWLHQCWKEHRVVPHESYKILPFSGLTICVTQVPVGDERKEIEKLVVQNGGKYSAELTRNITHLVCHAPEGDKYKVAKSWGSIHVVTREWFNQSVARKVCLNEESYPVERRPSTSMNNHKTCLKVQHSQDKFIRNSQCDTPGFINEDDKAPIMQHQSSMHIDGCVAGDSKSEDSGLYLLNCKFHLVGFDASEMRRLVNMVRRGGGSRYMSLDEQLTHIVVGTPSESEKREVRSLSASGVINVVRTLWLEDCELEKKEIPILQRHVAYALLLPKDSISFSKGYVSSMQPTFSNDQSPSLKKGQQKVQHGISDDNQDNNKSSVFRGRSFCFSSSFPDIQRDEIVDWIHDGGGEVADTTIERSVSYIVESHGVLCSPTQSSGATIVSSHWIRSCLQDGNLLDVSSHILFSPLQCKVPLPGFIGLHFFVFQYEEKDIALLRNLCHILGGRLVKKLTKKNKIVAFSQFLPKEATSISDREAGICTKDVDRQVVSRVCIVREEVENSVICNKRSRLLEDGNILSFGSCHVDPVCRIISTENNVNENDGKVSTSVPDVAAAAIEALLDQTSKVFTSDCSRVDHDLNADHPCSTFELSNHWTRRSNEKDGITNTGSTGEENTNIYGGFSETQTASQVVSYEEDLSGRQMIIDRFRTQSKFA